MRAYPTRASTPPPKNLRDCQDAALPGRSAGGLGSLSSSQIKQVRVNGVIGRVRLLRLHALSNLTGRTRLALSVRGRLGSAVVRNRLRRRLREIVRLSLPMLAGDWDFLLVAQLGATKASFGNLKSALHEVWLQTGLISELPLRTPKESGACQVWVSKPRRKEKSRKAIDDVPNNKRG